MGALVWVLVIGIVVVVGAFVLKHVVTSKLNTAVNSGQLTPQNKALLQFGGFG